MFVVKMNATLDTVLFAAMISGTSQDQVYAMKVDAAGDVVLVAIPSRFRSSIPEPPEDSGSCLEVQCHGYRVAVSCQCPM